jgi:Inorganic Pyrophosphatase/Type III restriction enzyme, res subunit
MAQTAFENLPEAPAAEGAMPEETNYFSDSFFKEPSATGGGAQPAPAPSRNALNRMRAEDLSARGIPTYRDASGDVAAIRDESGAALTGFQSKSGIAYDAKGEPKQISYDETGPPKLSDPFANIPPKTDPKTGAVEQYGPGGTYKYLGQDPDVTAKLNQQAGDKDLGKEATLLGRKLTLDEHDLVQGTKQQKQLHEDLLNTVGSLRDPKFHGANADTVHSEIDNHFDQQYAAPEANAKSGFFGTGELTPQAQALRTQLDQQKADAHGKADQIYDLNDKLSDLHDSIQTQRQKERANVETMLAHQEGKLGPLDQPAPPDQYADGTPKVGPAGELYPPQEDWQRMLGGKDAVAQVQDQVRAGNIPPAAAPATIAATNDLKDAQQKAEDLKQSDPTLADKYKNVAANLLNGLNNGVGDLIKAMTSDQPFPGGSSDPLNWLPKGVSDLERKAFGKSFGDVLSENATRVSAESAKLVDDRLKGTLAAKVANIAGGLTPYVATAIATRGTSVATPLMASMFYSTGYQSTLADAKAHGASPAAAEGAATTVGVINAVLALPLKAVGAAAEAVFGDTAPKIIQRQIQNAYDAGGAPGVYKILSSMAQYLKEGRAGAYTGKAKEEVGQALENLMGELQKTPAQRMATVAATAAQHAALGAGVQTASNVVKKSYNPDQGTFEGVPEQALLFGGLGAVSEGFKQVADARKAKQALDIISGGKGAGGAQPPALPGPKAPEPPSGGGETPTKGGEKPSEPKPSTQRGISPSTGEGKPAGEPAGEQPRPKGAVAQPDNANAKPAATGAESATATATAEPGSGQPVLTSIKEAEKAFVEQGGHADKLEGQQKLEALREKYPAASDRLAAINEHLAPAPSGVETVDEAAHEAATSPKNELAEPSTAQKEAGNYQKGHVTLGGLDVAIENPAGSIRKAGFKPLQSHYGYIKGTVGADKDHVDAFIKQGTPLGYGGPVFVVNQHNQAGKFDEHKAVIGVNTAAEAKKEYLSNYQKGWNGGKSVVKFRDPAAFKQWAETGAKGQLTQEQASAVVVPKKQAGRPLEGPAPKQTKLQKRASELTHRVSGIGPRSGSENAVVMTLIRSGTGKALDQAESKIAKLEEKYNVKREPRTEPESGPRQDAGEHPERKADEVSTAKTGVPETGTGGEKTGRVETEEDSRRALTAAQEIHADEAKQLGVKFNTEAHLGDRSGIAINRKTGDEILVDHRAIVRSGWTHDGIKVAIKEELIHSRYLKVVGVGFSEKLVGAKIWTAMTPDQKAAAKELYPDAKDSIERAAEWSRAVYQFRTTGTITEALYANIDALKPLLEANQSPVLEDILQRMGNVTEGEKNATTSGKQPSGKGEELPRISPRTDVRKNAPEVRKKDSEQATGGSGAVERPPAPKAEQKPSVRQSGELDEKGNKALDTAFEGLFAGKPFDLVAPPLKEGERVVTVQRADGSTYLAAFGDKYWDFPGRGKIPAIGHMIESGRTDGMLGKGEKIIEPPLTGAPAGPPESAINKAVQYHGRVFTGESHEAAQAKLEKAFPQARSEKGAIEFGFKTTTGRFVDKKEADALYRARMDQAMRDTLGAAKPYSQKDMEAQSKWLNKQAGLHGMTIATLAKSNPDLFTKLAVGWRRTHPLEETQRESLAAGKPQDEFSLEHPESDAELKARLEREKQTNEAQRVQQAKKDQVKHGWKQKLTGDTGDLGQKDMFGKEELFAARPDDQLAIPPEKMAGFIAAAQEMARQGIDTPEKMVKVLEDKFQGKARPYYQGAWDAIGMIRPELRGTHDFSQFVKKPAKVFRAPQPDGGFADHPFIAAISNEFGGILSKTAAIKKLGKERFDKNASDQYDDAPRLSDPRHGKIYNPKSGQMPDQVATGLADMGLLPDGNVPAMWKEIDKISKSSKRIERQERVENEKAKAAEAEAAKAPNGALGYFKGDQIRYTGETRELHGGTFHVFTYLEGPKSGEEGVTTQAPDTEQLPGPAELDMIEPDDTGSGLDLEPDSGEPEPSEPRSEDLVPAEPGANRPPEPLLGDLARGQGSAEQSSPLSDDVPSAPGRAPSDQPIRGPASPTAERPAGSVEPARSGGTSESGLPADTDRTRIPGENLVLSGESGRLAGSSGSGGAIGLDDIARSAPALQPEQVEDVRFIESRLFEQNKPGVLLTNGTGTGKTFSGLGAIKRALDKGAKHILVTAPSDKIGSDWVATAKTFFGIDDAAQLQSTSENGKGHRLVVTTHANAGQNDTLVQRPWDMIVVDEAQYLSSAADGADTEVLDAVRALTWHDEGVSRRVKMLEPEATDALRALRQYERRFKHLSPEQKAERDKHTATIAAREKEVREKLFGTEGGVKWGPEMFEGREVNMRRDTPGKPAMSEGDKPKVIFLSATPFAYRKNVQYGHGYLFDYPKVEARGYNTPSPYGQFMIENFGYRMRYGKLTEPENAAATGILERRFAERLMREKSMRGRALVVPHDYSRDFVLTETQLGKKIDDIISKMQESPRTRILSKYIGVNDYLQRRFILEALKAREAIPRIRQHIALGRKMVVFHDYKLGGAINPLVPTFDPDASQMIYDKDLGQQTVKYGDAFNELKAHFPEWDAVSAELNNLKSPIALFTQLFKPEELGIFNGSVPKRQRRDLVKKFNTVGGPMKVFLAQRASAKEGISLHDLDGNEQRAFIDLGIPGRPTDAIQSEGRIYRIGVKSNAVNEYLVTGTNFERWTFAQTIAQRASTAENLAMGEGARALLMSFSTGFNEATAREPSLEQGVGGKAADEVRERGNPYKNAVALYYTNEKKTSRTKSREGTDYFATPEPVGYKMIEWANLAPGEKFLEPSAGHGAIARFAPDSTNRHAVEPSNELAGRLALNAPDTEIHNVPFEDYSVVNKFDAIAMNSPWGVAGKTAMEHLEKAAKHLKDGGRLVALIPRGKMDERFDEWLASEEGSDLHLRAEIRLPAVTFARAGTSIVGRVVVIDKTSDKETALSGRQHDLSDETDIKKLFDRLEHLGVPARPPKKAAPEPATEEPEQPPAGKTDSGGYTVDVAGNRQPLSPASTLVKPTLESSFVPADFTHTKTGAPIYVAKTARWMSKADFALARDRAKAFGGYYSSFKGAGAIPGFHFKNPEARDRFLSGGEVLGAGRPLKAASAIYKDDIERIAKEIGMTVKESLSMLQHLVSPTSGVAEGALNQAMKMLGTRYEKAYQTDRVLEAWRKAFDEMDRPDQVAFIDNMKQGNKQPTEELQQLADVMRKIDTESWKAAVDAYKMLGFKGDNIPLSWLDNHFRVLWKKIPGSGTEKGEWIGRARRGLRGSMGQHKQHTLESMSEGLEEGGVPYSYNPVVMFKLAQADLWKLTSTLRMWKWGKDNAFVQFVKGPFPKPPEGMVPLDDSIAKVYFPAESGEGLINAGQYFVEQGFGRILNNYLSKDHIRAVKLGQGLIAIKNATTQLELALSPFHAIFETLETVGSNIGLGLSKLVNRGILGGNAKLVFEGLKDMATAPVTPITQGIGKNSLGAQFRRALVNPDEFFNTPEGKKMLKKYPIAQEAAKAIFDAGFKPPELEQDWKNNSIRAFVDAMSDIKAGASDNYIGAGLRAFPAANEMLMKPLFDTYIPNLKVAQFLKEYGEAIEQNERKLKGGILTRAALARQTWSFVEKRFGEMNYDSFFWNGTFKSAMQLMFRSVTWKLGSVYAFGGAFTGQAKEFRDAFKEGRAPQLHPNMAWLFGMMLLTAAMGTIAMKVFTGKNPESITDLVFPQIDPKDNKVRVSFPTYFKDLVHLIHSPTSYVTSSMSGWIGRVADLLRNKDYYGTEIHDNDDPVVKQALQVGKYLGQTLLPFSIRGYKNISARDVGALRKAISLMGVQPAPRFIGQTKAEQKTGEYWQGQRSEAGIKPGQLETKLEKRMLVSQLEHGHAPDIAGALAKGTIKPTDVKSVYQRASMGELASSVLHMPLWEAEKIYQSANLRERASLETIMAKKRANAAKSGRTAFSGF